MGVTIRSAIAGDAQQIARVHVVSWQTTYRGIVPQAFLASLDIAARTEDWKTWLNVPGVHVYVAERDEEICGFASGGALREARNDFEGVDAEVYAIYLLDSAQGHGAGRLLMQRLAESLHGRGFSSAALWVLAENPSRGFYERLGGKRIAEKTIRIGDADLLEVAYSWSDIRALCDQAAPDAMQ